MWPGRRGGSATSARTSGRIGGRGPEARGGAGGRGQTSAGAGFRLRQGPGGRAEARRAEAVSRPESSPIPEYPGTVSRRFSSIEDLIARTGVRRDELATLADIGALESFGRDRRSALWQVERAVRPSGALFEQSEAGGRAGLESARCGGRLQPARSTRVPSTQYRSPSASVSAPSHVPARARRGRLRRDGPDDRPASHELPPARAGAARHPARERPAARPARPPRARGRRRHHAPAPRHGEGVRVPHARGRDRHRERHRAARSVRRAIGWRSSARRI